MRMGRFGAELLGAAPTVLTHCNAGALATAGYGTALGVIRAAVESGKQRRRLRRRDAAVSAGRAAHRVGAAARRHRRHAHHRQHGRPLLPAGEVRRRDRRRGPHRRERRHGEQDRDVHRGRARARARRAVLRRGAGVDDRSRTARAARRSRSRSAAREEVDGDHRHARRARGRSQVRHPAFDVTPARLITAIITERGVLRPPYEEAIRNVCAATDRRALARQRVLPDAGRARPRSAPRRTRPSPRTSSARCSRAGTTSPSPRRWLLFALELRSVRAARADRASSRRCCSRPRSRSSTCASARSADVARADLVARSRQIPSASRFGVLHGVR